MFIDSVSVMGGCRHIHSARPVSATVPVVITTFSAVLRVKSSLSRCPHHS